MLPQNRIVYDIFVDYKNLPEVMVYHNPILHFVQDDKGVAVRATTYYV